MNSDVLIEAILPKIVDDRDWATKTAAKKAYVTPLPWPSLRQRKPDLGRPKLEEPEKEKERLDAFKEANRPKKNPGALRFEGGKGIIVDKDGQEQDFDLAYVKAEMAKALTGYSDSVAIRQIKAWLGRLTEDNIGDVMKEMQDEAKKRKAERRDGRLFKKVQGWAQQLMYVRMLNYTN